MTIQKKANFVSKIFSEIFSNERHFTPCVRPSSKRFDNLGFLVRSVLVENVFSDLVEFDTSLHEYFIH